MSNCFPEQSDGVLYLLDHLGGMYRIPVKLKGTGLENSLGLATFVRIDNIPEQQHNMQTNSQHVVFIDYIRIVSCFLVMLVHASENFYGLVSESGLAGNMSMVADESARFWVAFYDGFIARTCVPLFMMVSAFLLVPMGEGETMTSFYRRRFRRILPPFVIFLFAYSLLPMLWGAFTWEQSLSDLKLLPFNFVTMAGHLWFMYPLIGLYLIIPVVSPWLEKSSAREERIFLALFALSTFIPWLHRWVGPELWGEAFWNGFHMLWYCSGYLGYLVLAHYIRFHIDWSSRKRLVVGLGCFLAGSLFTLWSFWSKAIPGQIIPTPDVEWSWSFCQPNILISTFGAFLMFTAIRRDKSPKPVSGIARLTYGMYLMHIFYLVPIASLFIGGDVSNPAVPVGLAIPCIAILTYLCCLVTTKLLSLLPGSKWFVGC